MRRISILLLLLSGCVVMYGCAVGPDYKRPAVEVPAAYKESSEALGWKQAEPRDFAPRGSWWTIFGDPQLDGLMAKIDVSNQSIAAAEAQVRISAALADQARASFWPQVSGTVQKTESQPSAPPVRSSASRPTGAPSIRCRSTCPGRPTSGAASGARWRRAKPARWRAPATW